MSFTKFEPHDTSGSKEPMISIRKSGSFGLNKACFNEYFEDAKSVSLFYDEEDNLVGFKPHEEDKEDAYVLTEMKSGGSITTYAFMNRYNLSKNITTRYVAQWDDDNELLFIDLDEPAGVYGSPDTEEDEVDEFEPELEDEKIPEQTN